MEFDLVLHLELSPCSSCNSFVFGETPQIKRLWIVLLPPPHQATQNNHTTITSAAQVWCSHQGWRSHAHHWPPSPSWSSSAFSSFSSSLWKGLVSLRRNANQQCRLHSLSIDPSRLSPLVTPALPIILSNNQHPSSRLTPAVYQQFHNSHIFIFITCFPIQNLMQPAHLTFIPHNTSQITKQTSFSSPPNCFIFLIFPPQVPMSHYLCVILNLSFD